MGALSVSTHRHLQALDTCLAALEDANERGQKAVPARLASRLGTLVPGIEAGMPTDEALDRVFDQQERAMHDGAWAGEITRSEARVLTERIKRSVEEVSLLLREAHRRRAWVALGYPTWERYVRAEFDLSRTRSYELLCHAEVVKEIQGVTSMFGIPNISPYAALQIKDRLPEVTEALRARISQVHTQAQAAELVGRVVAEVRTRTRPHLLPPGTGAAERRLLDAIACLDALPPPAEVAAGMDRADSEGLRRAHRAARWLVEFTAAWSARDEELAG